MDPSWDWNQWWMNRGHYHDMYSLFTILGEPWKFTNPNCIGPFWEGFPYINQTFIMWLGGLGRLVVCPDYSGGTWISSSFFKVTSSINHFSRGLSHLQLGNQSRSLWITWLVLIVPIWAKWVHQTNAVSHKRLPESKHVHPWKLTWHCKTSVSNRNYIFKWWIFHLSC